MRYSVSVDLSSTTTTWVSLGSRRGTSTRATGGPPFSSGDQKLVETRKLYMGHLAIAETIASPPGSKLCGAVSSEGRVSHLQRREGKKETCYSWELNHWGTDCLNAVTHQIVQQSVVQDA